MIKFQQKKRPFSSLRNNNINEESKKKYVNVVDNWSVIKSLFYVHIFLQTNKRFSSLYIFKLLSCKFIIIIMMLLRYLSFIVIIKSKTIIIVHLTDNYTGTETLV